MLLYDLIIIVFMLALNALFACYEMALASITHSRLAVLANEKRKGAGDACFMKERMERSLAVTQLGITLVGAIAAAISGAVAAKDFAPYLEKMLNISGGLADFVSLVIIIVPLTFLTIVFAELFPKIFALNNRESVVLKFSPPLRKFTAVIYPLVAVMEGLVKKLIAITKIFKQDDPSQHNTLHELHAAVSLARQAKILGAQEEKIVLAASALSRRAVKEVAIPINEVFTICAQDSLTQALIKAHTDMHTRFPISLRENDAQTIAGYINFKDIIAALKNNPTNPTIKGIMRPIKRIDENMALSRLLEEMIHEKNHIAVVTRDDKIIVGLVTMEDIMEELVGDIDIGHERLPVHVYAYENSWIVGGSAQLSKICDIAGVCFDGSNKNITIAEWWESKTASLEKKPESLQLGSFIITARKFKRKSVAEVIITKTA
jgi:putative hemolysin